MNVSRNLGKHIFLFAVSLVVTMGCKNVMGPETGPSPSTGPGSPALGGWVSITGSPIVGETLTAEVTLLSAGGSISYSYQGGRAVSPGGAASRAAFSFLDEAGVSIQWLRENVVIGGGKTYTVQAEDAGCSITVRVSYPGYSGSVSSAPECSSPVLTFTEASQGLPDGLYITETLTDTKTGTLNNLLAWLNDHAKPGFSYTILLAAGTESSGPRTLDTATLAPGVSIRLRGDGAGAAITLSGNGALFLVEKTILTLENITLQGYAGNTKALVQVFDHGALELGAGSAITGNHNETPLHDDVADSWGGGGVAVFSGKLTMTGGEIKNNSTQNDGGGVFIWQESVFTMTGGEISGNRAGRNGGGINTCERNALNISGGTIKDNHADDGAGGGINIGEGSTVELSGGTIGGTSANTAHHGGGISIWKGSVKMTGGIISGNEASESGGGIDVEEGSTVEISGNAEINENKADELFGGGIHVWKGFVKMTGGTISGNIADEGGGIDVDEGSAVEISGNAKINENEALFGGGIHTWRKGFVKMTGGTISENIAVRGGGGIYINEEGSVELSGGTISGNTATEEGGGISVYKGSVTMTGGTINNNRAVTGGGGGMSIADGSLNISGGTIRGNTAKGGGGIRVWKGFVKITGGTISGNTAGESGGGILVTGESSFTKTGGLIDGGPVDYQSPVNRVVNGSNALESDKGHAIYIDFGLWRDNIVGQNEPLSYNGVGSSPTYSGDWTQ